MPINNGNKVIVIYAYGCGCGFKTEDEREAISHSFSTGHCMTIHGRVLVTHMEEVSA